MIYDGNIENLKKAMSMNPEKHSGIHNINNVAPLLPFETREPERPKFKRKFLGVTGELVRLLNKKGLSKEFDLEKNIDEIALKVKCKDEENRKYYYTAKIELTTGGNYGYTFRIMPQHEMLLDSENLDLVKWITK